MKKESRVFRVTRWLLRVAFVVAVYLYAASTASSRSHLVARSIPPLEWIMAGDPISDAGALVRRTAAIVLGSAVLLFAMAAAFQRDIRTSAVVEGVALVCLGVLLYPLTWFISLVNP